MKFISLFFVFSFLFGIHVFSLDANGTTWGPEKTGHGFYLSFTNGKDFKLVYSGEGGGQNVLGVYTQKGNEITLDVVTINDWGELPDYIRQKTIKCTVVETDSLFSQYKLIGGGLELWQINSKPGNNKRRTVDGFLVYSREATGRLNDNSRVREGPSLYYNFYSFSFEDEPEVYSSLPKGYSIQVLGYSQNLTAVDGREYPWYYCVFRLSMWEEKYGWIWGGLIDF